MEERVCTKCGGTPPHVQFKMRGDKTGLESLCAGCRRVYDRAWGHTPAGWLGRLYKTQRRSSKKRGHPHPSYTQEELGAWASAQGTYKTLWEDWVASGFERMRAPSVDRIDICKPYTLGNIRLVSWEENKLKYHLEEVSRRPQKNNTSGYTGIRWEEDRGCFLVRIKVKGKTMNLGRAPTLDEALSLRRVAEEKYRSPEAIESYRSK